jgi:hypothetical protein
MIVFDLQCGNAHVFEAWFGSSADFDSQQRRKLIGCPLCDDTSVKKAVMAPNVAAKGNQKSTAVMVKQEEDVTPVAHAPAMTEGAMPTASDMKQLMDVMAEMQTKIEATAENVGDAFPEEARKIHYGESEAKPIYGEASLKEAAELQEEGIDILPLPFKRRRNKRLDA